MSSPTQIFSIYRTYSRQVRRLPHLFLRQFFSIKLKDDIRNIISSSDSDRRLSMLKRISKDLKKLEAANNGQVKAFNHILDIAYGRKGKLRWEIMKPLLTDPAVALPPKVIPAVEKSRPPVYSPELKALLTSAKSRKTRPLALRTLTRPPKLPAEADVKSDEARLFGPFSKRREVNIRWRYFTEEWKKIRPPTQTLVREISSGQTRDIVDNETIHGLGIRSVGFQGQGVYEDAERLVGASTTPPLPRKGRHIGRDGDLLNRAADPGRHKSRWVRRRYQSLLSRLPLLVYTRLSGSYSVELSPFAFLPHPGPQRYPDANSVDLAWHSLESLAQTKKLPTS